MRGPVRRAANFVSMTLPVTATEPWLTKYFPIHAIREASCSNPGPEVKEKKAFVLFSTVTSPSPAILRLMVYSGHINALYLESARLVRRLIVRNETNPLIGLLPVGDPIHGFSVEGKRAAVPVVAVGLVSGLFLSDDHSRRAEVQSYG